MYSCPKMSRVHFALAISSVLDLINPVLVNHHKKVAYMAHYFAQKMGLPSKDQHDILIAGLLHDCGAFNYQEISTLNQFEVFELNDSVSHSYLGYKFLKSYQPFSEIAKIVKHHHVYWNSQDEIKEDIPFGSFLIHLADRITTLINNEENVLLQRDRITRQIREQKNKMFSPEAVEAFESIEGNQAFWLDIVSPYLNNNIMQLAYYLDVELNIQGLHEIAKFLYKIVDYRSVFTAAHSVGVAASAEIIARLVGFSQDECTTIHTAGLLHDLGKLAIPVEILEKNGPLDSNERCIINTHTFYTHRTLESIPETNIINKWASFHHERLDGSGYPFHLTDKELPLGSRIMAVADIFTAISEDRPYRKSMEKSDIMRILKNMGMQKQIDYDLVSVVEKHYDQISHVRSIAQTETYKDYQSTKVRS